MVSNQLRRMLLTTLAVTLVISSNSVNSKCLNGFKKTEIKCKGCSGYPEYEICTMEWAPLCGSDGIMYE